MGIREGSKISLKIPKAAEIIARKIKRRIVRRELKEGELLPPEVKLMEEFGVSRPTIREAYRILETQNLVSVTRGARGGAVVHRPDVSLITSHTLLALAWEKSTVKDVYQTRMTVEPVVVRRVAEVASRDVVEKLQPVLDQALGYIEESGRLGQLLTDFLDRLLDLTDDHLLKYMYLTVLEVVSRHQAIAMHEGRKVKGEALASVETHAFLNSYQKLINLMSAGKADEAEIHWRRHINYVLEVWVKDHDRSISELFPDYDVDGTSVQ